MKEILFILILLLSKSAIAQTSIDTNKFIQENTISLINEVLKDTTFKDVKYLYKNYRAFWIDSDTIKVHYQKRLFQKRKNDTIMIVIFNPFSEENLPFIIKQRKDTSTLVLYDSINDLIPTETIGNYVEGVLFVERPFFSMDFHKAYIRTNIDFKNTGIGFESYYILEKGVWKKTKSVVMYTFRV